MRTFPPISRKFTTVMAERDLTLVLDGEQQSLVLRFGHPAQDVDAVDSFDWRCPVELIGSSRESLHPGIGVDSMQALINAFKMAQIELESLERETGGHVKWLGQLGHGLPTG